MLHYLPELLITKEVLVDIKLLVEKFVRQLEEDIAQALDCHHYGTLISLNSLIPRHNPEYTNKHQDSHSYKLRDMFSKINAQEYEYFVILTLDR